MRTAIILLLLFLLVVPSVQAVPTMGAATDVGNNNFTLSATGCASSGCWFEYGIYPDVFPVWTVTGIPVGGTVTVTESNYPITPSTTYYAVACDDTGCSSSISFTTLAYTPLPTSTLGAVVTNITRSKGNILFIAVGWLVPYAWLFPSDAASTGISIVCGVMLFSVYWGFWRRGRSVVGPAIIGILTAPLFLYANQGLHLGIPPEFQAIAQALLYASMAGIVLSILKR